MIKKTPLRQCVGCRMRKSKKELIRIVRNPEGDIMTDPGGKMNGRGAYICRSEECLKKAARSGALARSLKVQIPEKVFSLLEKELSEIDRKS